MASRRLTGAVRYWVNPRASVALRKRGGTAAGTPAQHDVLVIRLPPLWPSADRGVGVWRVCTDVAAAGRPGGSGAGRRSMNSIRTASGGLGGRSRCLRRGGAGTELCWRAGRRELITLGVLELLSGAGVAAEVVVGRQVLQAFLLTGGAAGSGGSSGSGGEWNSVWPSAALLGVITAVLGVVAA